MDNEPGGWPHFPLCFGHQEAQNKFVTYLQQIYRFTCCVCWSHFAFPFPYTLFLKLYSLYTHISFFIFDCTGSSLLCAGFFYFQQAGATLRWGVQASHCSSFSCGKARALGAWASVVVVQELSCSVACGIFPIKLMSPALARGFHCTSREVP